MCYLNKCRYEFNAYQLDPEKKYFPTDHKSITLNYSFK